jgi:5'(3')-deoxyribonucleotidase
MKTLLVDMDAIVADLAAVWYKEYTEKTGRLLTKEMVTSWDVGKAIGDRSVYGVLADRHLYRRIPPIMPAIEVIKRLSKLKAHGEKLWDIHILTASITEPQIIPDKIWWLKEHMPFIDRKHQSFIYHKGMVHGDYFIDDAPKNLNAWKLKHPQGKTVTVTYPYNIGTPVDIRGDDYNNLEKAWSIIEIALMSDH